MNRGWDRYRLPLSIVVDGRRALLVLTLAMYVIFNYGFMQVMFPPVGNLGIPLGELVLLLYLVPVNYFRLYSHLSGAVFIAPVLVWYGLGLGRAVTAVPSHGMWALRDATHVIESLYLVVGFIFASRARNIELFFRFLPWLLLVGVVYALTYPFGATLQGLSPQVTAAAGHGVPLFFNYQGTTVVLLMAAAYVMISKPFNRIAPTLNLLLVVFIVGYTAFIFQYRTIYLQVIAIYIFLVFYRGRSAVREALVVVLLLLCSLAVISLLDIQIPGRINEKVSASYIINHFISIVGIKSEGLEGAAGGLALRIGWWIDLYHRWVSGPDSILFGLGYGFPLVDFVAKGIEIREPHNSYISIVARIGLVGAAAFVLMKLILFRIWMRGYRYCAAIGWKEGQQRFLILMIFILLVMVQGIGEDSFEKPYFAIPYYFIWGMIISLVAFFSSGQDYRALAQGAGPASRDTAGPGGP